MKDNKYWLGINISLILAFCLLLLYYLPSFARHLDLREGCCVSFIDVGKGDCALIELQGGIDLLIDGGELFLPGTQINHFEKTLHPWLKRRGVSSFDIVMVTHPHSDHIGGITEIIERYPVRTVIDHGYDHTSFLYEKFWKTIRKKKLAVLKPSAGHELVISEKAKLFFLSPPKGGERGDLNEDSLVCRFVYGDVSFLFMADAGIPAEKWLLSNMKEYLKSDVLKVGHHGSTTSSHREFIEAVSPAVSVICIGPNPHGLPKEEVTKTLKEAGSKVLRTDHNGTITVRTDGKTLRIKTEKE